jgi:predicted enzyme related to lactoylglutathione lyase
MLTAALHPHPERPLMPALSKALMTVIYPVGDVVAAKSWYAEVFGVEPYFDEPFYVGFNVAGYELGLVPAEAPLHEPGNRGAIAYWGVENADAAWKRVTAAGAKPLDAVKDVGEGIRVGVFADPYGNAIGLIENPHFAVKK